MSVFMLVAALLTLAALAIVAYPLLRRREGLPPAWPLVALLTLIVIGGGAALYPTWSNWNWAEPAPVADSPAAMVGRLARRLEKQPDDLQGWLLLGRSYSVIQQYSLSARAYERADKIAGGRNADALLGLGEALIESQRGDISGAAGKLFEKALAIEPNSVKALYYSAVAAAERNELALARTRFARLLQANPPESVQNIIQEQLRALDAMALLAGSGGAPAAGQAVAAVPAATAAAAPVTVVKVPVRVTLGAAVASKAKAGAPLFVLARIPGQRGPPLAVRRLESRFPLEVELLNTDAVMGGGGFTAGQELEIEARIANGGSAISASGDPYGVVRLKAGAAARTAIEINQLKP